MVFHEKQNEKKTIQEIGNNNMMIDPTLVSTHKRINIIQIGMVLKWFHEEKKIPNNSKQATTVYEYWRIMKEYSRISLEIKKKKPNAHQTSYKFKR